MLTFLLLASQADVSVAKSMRPPPDVVVADDVPYAKRGRRVLYMDLYWRKGRSPEAAPSPVVLFLHGGGWREGSRDQAAPILYELAQRGFVAVSIDYTLSQEETFPAQLIDCKTAVAWLKERADTYTLDPKRIGVFGSSAGGHLASLLGTTADIPELSGAAVASRDTYRVQAVVDLFGPVDLVELMRQRRSAANGRSDLMGDRAPEVQLLGGDPQSKMNLAQMANPSFYASSDDPPFLIIQGLADTVVPPSQSRILQSALQRAGVRSKLVLLPNLGHTLDVPRLKPLIVNFFVQELKP